MITIAQNSGRAQISEFTRKPAEALSGSFRQGQFQVWPLTRTDKARRGLLWADVNGDGLPDLLVAEPESGQISLCFQQPDGSLGRAQDLPHPRRRQRPGRRGLERRRQAGDLHAQRR